jgi:hypothetical protein
MVLLCLKLSIAILLALNVDGLAINYGVSQLMIFKIFLLIFDELILTEVYCDSDVQISWQLAVASLARSARSTVSSKFGRLNNPQVATRRIDLHSDTFDVDARDISLKSLSDLSLCHQLQHWPLDLSTSENGFDMFEFGVNASVCRCFPVQIKPSLVLVRCDGT